MAETLIKEIAGLEAAQEKAKGYFRLIDISIPGIQQTIERLEKTIKDKEEDYTPQGVKARIAAERDLKDYIQALEEAENNADSLRRMYLAVIDGDLSKLAHERTREIYKILDDTHFNKIKKLAEEALSLVQEVEAQLAKETRYFNEVAVKPLQEYNKGMPGTGLDSAIITKRIKGRPHLELERSLKEVQSWFHRNQPKKPALQDNNQQSEKE